MSDDPQPPSGETPPAQPVGVERKLGKEVTMATQRRKFQILALVVLACCLVACGAGTKEGKVVGVQLVEGQMALEVQLDDGTTVTALPGEQSGPQITGGQRVKVKPAKGSKYWEVVSAE
jgi:hypothetical protein